MDGTKRGNYESGADYVLEYGELRFTFNERDFTERVEQAAIRLGFVGAPLDKVMKFLSITSHFQDFSRGVIDSSHVIFFLSVVAAALFLTYLSLQSRRWRA